MMPIFNWTSIGIKHVKKSDQKQEIYHDMKKSNNAKRFINTIKCEIKGQSLGKLEWVKPLTRENAFPFGKNWVSNLAQLWDLCLSTNPSL